MNKKYEVLGVVGEGAYGIVYKCKNKETGKYVAIKKFKETEDKLVQKTMKRELKMLQQLKHENIVEFQESFIHKGNLFLVFEYVEKNLLEVLEEMPDGLPPKLIKSFIYQICKALDYMHKNNMIHRDIKPENLLIDENLNLKLCDFGFARKVKLDINNNNTDEMTDYVATRWYRSPELLLSGGIYGPYVDYWAVGCIMGELADGNPMFPGENETDQINCIIKILGNLPEELVNMFYKNPLYEGKKLLHVNKPETLERRYIDKLGPIAIDFMKGLLKMDPNKRLNGETVFKHKYFSCFMKDEGNNSKKKTDNNNNINNNDNKNNNNKNNNEKKINDIKIKELEKEKNNNEELTNEKKEIKESKESKEKIKEKNNNDNKIYNIDKNENNNKENIKNLDNKKNTNNTPTNKVIETKVINNTTNINIINYNNGVSPSNNYIQINNNIPNNLNVLNNDNSINKNIDIKNNKNESNNIVINNNMIIKVQNNHHNNANKNKKIKKIEAKYKSNNFNYSNNTFTNDNTSFNIKGPLNARNNNNIFNYQMGNKKSLSQGKNINLIEYQNMSVTNKIPNLMTISLPPEKMNKMNKINNNLNNTIDNISSTFYSFKNLNNNKNNNSPQKSTLYNNSFYKNLANKKFEDKIMKSNVAPVLSNNYLGGYKTFFNKNKSSNDKYNYDINTKYFEEEMKKYNQSPEKYYNNIIDENEEYNPNYKNGINAKSFYNKNSPIYPNKKSNLDGKKLNNKIINKYKNNIYANKINVNGPIKYNYSNKKLNNGYGTIYNYGGGFMEKKNNVELPQLIKLYNNKHNTYRNNNNNIYCGYTLRNSKYY